MLEYLLWNFLLAFKEKQFLKRKKMFSIIPNLLFSEILERKRKQVKSRKVRFLRFRAIHGNQCEVEMCTTEVNRSNLNLPGIWRRDPDISYV
jgi:hypothetical protein